MATTEVNYFSGDGGGFTEVEYKASVSYTANSTTIVSGLSKKPKGVSFRYTTSNYAITAFDGFDGNKEYENGVAGSRTYIFNNDSITLSAKLSSSNQTLSGMYIYY